MTTALAHLALPQAVFANPATSILLPVTLGAAVGYSSRPDPNDKSLRDVRQPPLRPPARVFGPVWMALYALTGYAAHRVFGGSGPDRAPSPAAGLYTLQLGLNLAWMPLFYVLRRPALATADAVVLLGINALLAARWLTASRAPSSTLWTPAPRDGGARTAGWLWLPYVGWLAFATYLSAGTGYLNEWSLGSSTSTTATSSSPPASSSHTSSSKGTTKTEKRHKGKGKGKGKGSA